MLALFIVTLSLHAMIKLARILRPNTCYLLMAKAVIIFSAWSIPVSRFSGMLHHVGVYIIGLLNAEVESTNDSCSLLLKALP